MADNLEDVPLSRDVILFPAFNIGNNELYYFLKTIDNNRLLDKVLLICTADFFAEYPMQLKSYIVDDFKSYSTLVRKIVSWKRKHRRGFKGVLAIDEEVQFQLSRKLAGRFELEFFADITCFLASNKFLMKSSFEKHGVPTSRFTLISRLNGDAALNVGFPNVLKVLSGTQSQYVFYNEDEEDLKRNFHKLKFAVRRTNGDPRFRKQSFVLDGQDHTLDPKRQFLLEAYVPGEEYSCDFMIQSDAVQIIRVTKKIKGPYFGYFKGYQLLNEAGLASSNVDKAELIAICRKVSKALSIRDGVCMMDFKVFDGSIIVLEASIRPGLSAFNHLMYDVYGYTSLALMAMQKMGIPVCAGISGDGGAVMYLYASPDGAARSFDVSELQSLNDRLEVSATYTYRDADDCVTDSDFDRTSLLKGYVLLRDRDGAGVPETADAAGSKNRYRVKEPVE